MAFKLDNDLLEELGLAALGPDEKQAMLRQILETLEMRVGTTLASKMTEAQLDEFERLMPAEGDDQAAVQQKEQQALQWLESNFPNYKQVVNDELEKLKSEIRATAPQIVASSQQNALPAAPAAAYPMNTAAPATPAPLPQPAYQSQPPQGPSDAFMPPAAPQAPSTPYQPPQGFSAPPQQPPAGFTPPPPPPPVPGGQPPAFTPMPPSPNDTQPPFGV
jgi:hypothetical protein